MKYVLFILLFYGYTGKSVTTNRTLFEGENAILTCPFDAIHSFWEKYNKLIYRNNQTYSDRYRYRIRQNESITGHELEIINITTKDSGLFRCTNINDLTWHVIELLITIRPDVWVDNLGNGSLYCNTTGLESVDTIVKWEHRSVFNEPIRYFNSCIDGYLNLNETAFFKNYEKNGIYICVVENKNGTVIGNAITEVREFAVTPIEEKKDKMWFVLVGLLGSLSAFLILALVFLTWFFTKRSGNRHIFQPRSQDIPPESHYYEIDNIQLQDLNIRQPIQEVPMDNRFSYEHPYQPLSNDRPSEYQNPYQPFQQTRHYEQIEGDNMQTRSDEDNRASYVSMNQPHSEDGPSKYQDRCQNETIEQDDTNLQFFIDTGYTDAISKPCKL